MIISDLSYLEVVSEAETLEGGFFFSDDQFNYSSIGQHSGESFTQQVGLVNANVSSNNVAVPVQANLNKIDIA